MVVIVAALWLQTANAVVPSGAHVRAAVLIVGDSNTILPAGVLAFQALSRENPYLLEFASRSGAGIRYPDCAATVPDCTTTDFWKVHLADVAETSTPQLVVSNLGVNDTLTAGAWNTQGFAYYGLKIDYLMRLLPVGKVVLWTNLPCAIEGPSRKLGCGIIDSALDAAVARWTNLRVLDWAALADPHPEYMAQPGTDNPHYSAAGQTAWASYVVGQLDFRTPNPV